MKRISLVLIYLVLAINNGLFSQTYQHPLIEQIDNLRTIKTLFDSGDNMYESIDGTPFLSGEFLQGSVSMKSGELYSGEFRYDIYADQVQFMGNNTVYCIAFPEDIVWVKVGDDLLKFLSYADRNKVTEGYLLMLADGYYSLYAKLQKTLNPSVPEKPYQPAEPAKFVDKDEDYYIMVGDNTASRVKNKKDLVGLVPGKEKVIEDFINNEGIKPNNRLDLVKLVTFLNSL